MRATGMVDLSFDHVVDGTQSQPNGQTRVSRTFDAVRYTTNFDVTRMFHVSNVS
jgi:hypothetical protein